MRQSKYPLEALAALRDSKADKALGRLAAAIDARVSAERALDDCKRRRAAHDDAVALLTSEERHALARGELGAADLARGDAWKMRVFAEREALEAEQGRAVARRQAALDAESAARDAAMACQSDARLVHEDRERWTERVRALAEAAEDEAHLEAWRPLQ
jgi:hypothetical protein